MGERQIKPKASDRQRRRDSATAASVKTTRHILKSARDVLVTHGHSGFTTRRVAEAAGISPGNLSYHFPSKRELLQALIGQLVADYLGNFEAILSSVEIPRGQELQHLARWLLTDAVDKDSMSLFRELWAMSLNDDVVREEIDNLYDELMARVAALLQRSYPNADVQAIREVVQYLALMSEGSIVLYGTRRQRAVSFERIMELTVFLAGCLAPELRDLGSEGSHPQ